MADDLRRQLGELVTQLLQEYQHGGRGESVAPLLRGHLGDGAGSLPILTESLEDWELPNLQLGIEAVLARDGWSASIVGLAGQARRYQLFGLSDLMSDEPWVPTVGAPEYVNMPCGPGETMPCLEFALLLVTAPDGPLVCFVRRGQEGMVGGGLAVQAVAGHEGAAGAFLADLRAAMDEHDVYRGQVLTVKVDAHGGRQIVFLERPRVPADELVLPEGLLDRVERHVLAPTRHREQLLASGRHLSRGLLLWGPPGTGKTLTVRHLAGRLEGATVVVLSGGSLGLVAGFAALAKRLAPSLVVLEDVDLVAEERTFGAFVPFPSSPVLFELMNEMDGIGEDADVAWVLTTNRPDALEPALAARPGRIDLALELPMPDADARRRLLALYGRGLELRLADADAVVARTEGAPASFFKELLRSAAIAAAEAGSTTVTDAHVTAVLDELLAEGAKLTRVLLGAEAPGGGVAPTPHEWLEGLPGPGAVSSVIMRQG